MTALTTVWIDNTCIGCGCCSQCYPAVFSQPEEKAFVVGAILVNGITSDNDSLRSPLTETGRLLQNEILEAVAGCPVESIRYATIPEGPQHG